MQSIASVLPVGPAVRRAYCITKCLVRGAASWRLVQRIFAYLRITNGLDLSKAAAITLRYYGN